MYRLRKAIHGYIRTQYERDDFPDDLRVLCLQFYFDETCTTISNIKFDDDQVWKWRNDGDKCYIRCGLKRDNHVNWFPYYMNDPIICDKPYHPDTSAVGNVEKLFKNSRMYHKIYERKQKGWFDPYLDLKAYARSGFISNTENIIAFKTIFQSNTG